jgi:hypothetical protein
MRTLGRVRPVRLEIGATMLVRHAEDPRGADCGGLCDGLVQFDPMISAG